MKEEFVRALFTVVGLPIRGLRQIENEYWPKAYKEEIEASPWWIIEIDDASIRIGYRKRVMSINWTESKIRKIVTDDAVTKSETLVHAYTTPKAVEYLCALRREIIDMQAIRLFASEL